MDPSAVSADPGAVSGNNSQTGSSFENDSNSESKMKSNKKYIVGLGVLMFLAGALTIDWTGSSSGGQRYSAYGEEEGDSASDPEYLKIKGRRVEDARSGRGVLHSIFCRGNQRSNFCSR